MRAIHSTSLPLVLLLVLGCSSEATDPAMLGAVAASRSPIEFGTPDTTHSGEVVVLSQTRWCSGSIVKVATDRTGYVLTAAHCCTGAAINVPAAIYVGQDVGAPSAVRYSVNPGSVYYDAGYTGGASPFDFCMMTFSDAAPDTKTLALPTIGGDGLGLNVIVELVGYGITAPPLNTNNNVRYHGTTVLDMPFQADINQLITYSEAGPTNITGTCPGDSGGAVLFPAGASPSQQLLVGVHSFAGPADAQCGAYTFGGSSRVLSRIGPGRFITNYVTNGSMAGIGILAGSTPVPALPSTAFALLGSVLLVLSVRVARRRAL